MSNIFNILSKFCTAFCTPCLKGIKLFCKNSLCDRLLTVADSAHLCIIRGTHKKQNLLTFENIAVLPTHVGALSTHVGALSTLVDALST